MYSTGQKLLTNSWFTLDNTIAFHTCQFIGNMLYPERPDGITEEDGIITIHAPDARIKGKIYGRDRTRLKFVADVVKRQFPVKELKVV